MRPDRRWRPLAFGMLLAACNAGPAASNDPDAGATAAAAAPARSPSGDAPAAPSAVGAAQRHAAGATGAHPALRIQRRETGGRRYLALSAHRPAAARWAITLERPATADANILAAFPATYTSPDDDVEGVVMIDGQVVRRAAKPWEALLIVSAGAPRIRRTPAKPPGEAVLAPLRRKRASLLQGHLLAIAGRRRPIKPSPALQRRALAITATGAAVIQSQHGVELARFADDLLALGARAAMNLDMGMWSEGWYRSADGGIITVGRDRRATQRQSNWLVVRLQQAAVSPQPAASGTGAGVTHPLRPARP